MNNSVKPEYFDKVDDSVATAARNKNLPELKWHFKDRKKSGSLMLYICAEQGYSEGVQYFLSKGVKTTGLNRQNGETPFHAAVRSGSREIVQILIEANADINARGDYGQTPLIVALRGRSEPKSLEMAQLLIDKGAQIGVRTESGETLIHIAITDQHLDVAEFVLSRGSKQGMHVSNATPEGKTPLHIAVEAEYIQGVNFLLKRDADVTAKYSKGWTPLHVAARCKPSFASLQIVQALLKAKDLRHQEDEARDTPVAIAGKPSFTKKGPPFSSLYEMMRDGPDEKIIQSYEKLTTVLGMEWRPSC